MAAGAGGKAFEMVLNFRGGASFAVFEGAGNSQTRFVDLERNFGSGMILTLCPVK